MSLVRGDYHRSVCGRAFRKTLGVFGYEDFLGGGAHKKLTALCDNNVFDNSYDCGKQFGASTSVFRVEPLLALSMIYMAQL